MHILCTNKHLLLQFVCACVSLTFQNASEQTDCMLSKKLDLLFLIFKNELFSEEENNRNLLERFLGRKVNSTPFYDCAFFFPGLFSKSLSSCLLDSQHFL